MMSKKQITGVGIAVLLIAIYFGVKFYASNVAEKMVNEAIVKVANGEDDRAIRDYNKAIELKPKLAVAYYNRGTVVHSPWSIVHGWVGEWVDA